MLPWTEMLRAAVTLGLSPQAFWACSLKEWRWLTQTDRGGLARDGFERLAAEFPDRKEGV